MFTNNQPVSFKRLVLVSLILGLIFNIVVSLPMVLLTWQYGQDTAGWLFAFLIVPLLITYFVITLNICIKQKIQSYVLIPLLNIFTIVGAYILLASLGTFRNVFPAITLIFVTVILPIFVTLSVELPQSGKRNLGRRLISYALVIVVLVGLLLGVTHVLNSKSSSRSVNTYNVIDFPVYYLSNDSEPSRTLASLTTSQLTNTPMITFFPHYNESFSETKFNGTEPVQNCGVAYGQELSSPTIWECTVAHQTNTYTLFRERLTYSNPDSAEKYGYSYFAIYKHQTVVWYGNSKDIIWSTEDPVTKIINFYDSLKEVSLQSPQMIKILGNVER